jgi:RNA polymerase sigma-70 factor (ECF subfamily)
MTKERDMSDQDFLAERFEAQRDQLRGVAYRMLGSTAEADDAVQEAWLRLSRSDAAEIENLGGWLTTVVARICLNALRSRKTRGEQPIDEVHIPDPVVGRLDEGGPESEAVLADSVGLAMLVVLETLSPAERLAFVLHDMFAVPFDEIAEVIDRSPEATRQLASRARRRVQGDPASARTTDPARHREVVDAFLAASRSGSFEALVSVLDPDIVLRIDDGSGLGARLVRGAERVATGALLFSQVERDVRVVSVNGMPGLVTIENGRLLSVADFTVVDGKLAELTIVANPQRLAHLDLAELL